MKTYKGTYVEYQSMKQQRECGFVFLFKYDITDITAKHTGYFRVQFNGASHYLDCLEVFNFTVPESFKEIIEEEALFLANQIVEEQILTHEQTAPLPNVHHVNIKSEKISFNQWILVEYQIDDIPQQFCSQFWLDKQRGWTVMADSILCLKDNNQEYYPYPEPKLLCFKDVVFDSLVTHLTNEIKKIPSLRLRTFQYAHSRKHYFRYYEQIMQKRGMKNGNVNK